MAVQIFKVELEIGQQVAPKIWRPPTILQGVLIVKISAALYTPS